MHLHLQDKFREGNLNSGINVSAAAQTIKVRKASFLHIQLIPYNTIAWIVMMFVTFRLHDGYMFGRIYIASRLSTSCTASESNDLKDLID